MAVIPVKLDEIKEMRQVPIGRYDLQVVEVEEVTSKKGKPQYDMSIAIEGYDDAPNIRHFHSLPAAEDEAKAFKFKVLMLKRLCYAFGIPLTGDSIDTTQIASKLRGARARSVEVGLDKETDADGKEKPGGRTYNRLVLPLLPDESTGRGAPPPPKR